MPANSRNVAIARTLAKAWRPARDGRQQEQETPAKHRKDHIRRKAFEIKRRASQGMLLHQECQQQQDKISSVTPSSGLPNTADASNNSRNVSNSITASN
jgi:hypothetical protein